MIYKTLKKVSDYCQLLDKSRYEVTQTNRGVTFTNNGDGTITANGTATGGNATFNLQSSITVVAGHKYLVSTDYTNQVRIQLYTGPNDIFASYNTANVPQIITCINNYNYVYYQIIFYNGVTVSGAILKPQLFDLTEMYGSGNEPKTVEEFKTKFPNELYDYKPYCFVKSYKNCLTCTTKNLFDSEDWYNTLHAINSTSMVKETVNGIEYYKFRPNDIFNYEYMKGKFKENTVYTLSCLGMNADGTNNRYSGFQVYYTDGTKSLFYINTGEEQKYTITTLSNKTVDYIILGYNVSGYVLVRNIQLEEGSTASEYQPYGYIQSRKKSLKVTDSILL